MLMLKSTHSPKITDMVVVKLLMEQVVLENLQSPEEENLLVQVLVEKPVYCEDDHYKWGDVPEEILEFEQWKKADTETKRKDFR